MRQIFLFIAFSFSFHLFGQESKTVSISPFLGVSVYSGIHLKLIPSDENKMVISGENIETVVFTLKKDVLKIRHSFDQILNPSNTYVELHFTEELDALSSYQGTTIETTAELKTTSMNIKASEGSKQDLRIVAEKIDSRVNSGANLTLTGTTTSHDLSILGGGIFEGETLQTEQTKVKVTGGGLAYTHASELLDATVSVGGTVRVYGQPTKLVTKKVVGGSIIEMN